MITFGKFKISALSILYFAFVYIANPGDYFFMLLLSATLHEAGHIFAAKMLGVKIDEFGITLLGAKLKLGGNLVSYSGDALIYLAGAVSNLSASFTALVLRQFYSDDRLIFFVFANLAYAVFNMLPIRGLDGGGFLLSLLCRKGELYNSERILDIVSLVFVIFFCILSVFLITFTEFNLSLTAALIFFLTLIGKDKKRFD